MVDSLGTEGPRVLDASTAHRVAPGWAYGFPELAAGQADAIASARRVANPGCYATGAIALLRPLVDAGLIAAGPSARDQRGVRLFRRRAADDRGLRGGPGAGVRALRARPRAQACARDHGLCAAAHAAAVRPFGRQFPPGHAGQRAALPRRSARQAPCRRSRSRAGGDHYAGQNYVRVVAAEDSGKLEPEALNGTNDLEIRVFANEARRQAVVVARLDNLGKGASGAAVQNLQLMLGL